MPGQNFLEYQKSIAGEFKALQNRVRNLIGDVHWGEDGRYKEILLLKMLKRVLPEHISVGTGFVMTPNGQISKQIDLVIYENRKPLYFKEDDLVIVSTTAVLGIIEVKTQLRLDTLEKVFESANHNGELIGKHIFNGIFSYNNEFELNNETKRSRTKMEECLKRYPNYINHISCGENYFIRYWSESGNSKYSMYRINDLSFSYFISNLIEMCYKLSMSYENTIDYMNSFLYSIEEGKESYKFADIIVRN